MSRILRGFDVVAQDRNGLRVQRKVENNSRENIGGSTAYTEWENPKVENASPSARAANNSIIFDPFSAISAHLKSKTIVGQPDDSTEHSAAAAESKVENHRSLFSRSPIDRVSSAARNAFSW